MWACGVQHYIEDCAKLEQFAATKQNAGNLTRNSTTITRDEIVSIHDGNRTNDSILTWVGAGYSHWMLVAWQYAHSAAIWLSQVAGLSK